MINGCKVVALCVSEIQNENTQSMIYPMYQSLLEKNWRCLIYNTATDLFRDTPFDRGEASVFQLMDFSVIDAVVVYTQCLKCCAIVEDILAAASQHQVPVFLVEPTERYSSGIRITFDELDAFRELVTHLIEHHHVTKFACIAGFRGNPASETREMIFRDVLKEHGVAFDEKWFGYGDFYAFPTKALMERFLAEPEGLPEAIVCINDSMAIAVCEVLSDHGYSVPDDVIVTGFDGIIQEQYNFPRLTTCRRDMKQLGAYMAELLERSLSDTPMKQEYIFPYTLDVSQSCGCRKCTMESVSRAVNAIYSRMNDSEQYDRSMKNMLTKLTFEHDSAKIHEILRYYIRSDSYLCMNSDFEDDNPPEHTYEEQPFTDVVLSHRFFYGEQTTETAYIAKKSLIPDWSRLIEKPDPVVFYSIHNQQMIYGYLAVFANPFNYAVQRMQQFVLTFDSCVGMFAQQEFLRSSNQRLKEIQNKIIISFADMVESRDDFTGQHVKRTSEYLRILVKYLAEMPEYANILTPEMQERMYKAAPLHDIGKIKISDVVLNKPGKLTPEEFEVIKTHAESGGEIIEKTLTDIESDSYLKVAREMALYHHEKWNGTGYPYHLSGEDIPLCARIMAVVDVFDALTSKRVYKDAFPVEKAFRILEESSGSHFDPKIVGTFLAHKEEVTQVLLKYQDVHI